MKILGVFKIFGGIAILTGKLPRRKEWGYAAFRFNSSARRQRTSARAIAHLRLPFSFFVILVIACLLWHKTATTPLPFEQAVIKA